MNFLGKIFGGKKEQRPSSAKVIRKLRETENMLLEKQDFLEKKIELEFDAARENGTKNKRAAMADLQRKRRYEKQLQQICGTLSTIKMQRETLERAITKIHKLTKTSTLSKLL